MQTIRSSGKSAEQSNWALALSPNGLLVLGFMSTLMPLLVVSIPPLLDYPNHLARIAVLHAMPAGSFSAEHYRLDSLLVPNLLFDAVAYGLAAVMPLEAAGRVFLALTMALLVGGTVALHRTLHGGTSCWPLLSLLALPGWPLLMGFLNYVAGVGLLLLASALWLRLEGRPWPLRLAVGAVCALALFFSHIVVVVLFAAVVGGYELQAAGIRLRAARNLLLAGLAFVPAGILFLAGSPTGTPEIGRVPVYSIPEKLAALPAMLTSGVPAADAVALALLLPLVALAAVALRISFARRFALALAAAAFVFCLLPNQVFSLRPGQALPASFLDTRVPFALFLLAVAATDAVPRRRHLAAALVAAIVGLIALRDVAVTWQWASFERQVAAYRAAAQRLPPGSTLFIAREEPAAKWKPMTTRPSVWLPTPDRVGARLQALLTLWLGDVRLAAPMHLGTISVFEAEAFVPQLFADAGTQPITIREEWAEPWLVQRNGPSAGSDADLAALVAQLRAVAPDGPAFLLLAAPGPMRLVPPAGVGEIARGPSFRLFCLAECGGVAAAG